MGRALALLLIERGASVAGVDFNENSITETQLLLKENRREYFSIHVLSIDDKEKILKLPSEIIAIHGKIDGIINNAGIIQPFVKVSQLDYNAIEKVFNVNFYGTLFMIKTFMPILEKRPESLIMNISSMGGFLPVPGQAVYGASKAAVKLLTEALYAELLNTNIHVSIVFPGAVATNITTNSGVKIPEMKNNTNENKEYKALSAEKAAEIIASGIEKNKTRIFVGSDSKMMDILYRIAPLFAVKFIAKQMKSLLSEN